MVKLFEYMASGLPMVTLPGRFMRGRQSAAMLGLLGLDELIAHRADEYVETTLKVGHDRDLRHVPAERRHHARLLAPQ